MTYHTFRRVMQRIALKTLRKMSQHEKREHSAYEKECISVCKALISREDTALLISPISGKKYIRSEDDQIFIIIDSNQITIVNHQYSYNIDIWGKPLLMIINLFDIEVEKRREKMESEIRSNVKHSLSSIYQSLIHEKKS